jgi:wyosine [tRNA(Phe)-imidazoG37] synthetase (radical SAM superfamily)
MRDQDRITDGIVQGPFPFRDLGISLNVNPLPDNRCAYDCLHCRHRRETGLTLTREPLSDPEVVARAVSRRLDGLDEAPDFILLNSHGEVTLDTNLGLTIRRLQKDGLRVAVATCGALLWDRDVREELLAADWVGVMVNTTRIETWRAIERPHPSLHLAKILDGLLQFSKSYIGGLATDTILVPGVNDQPDHALELGRFMTKLNPAAAYLHPPADPWAGILPPGSIEKAAVKVFAVLTTLLEKVVVVPAFEGNGRQPGEEVPPGLGTIPMSREDLLEQAAKLGLPEEQVQRWIMEGALTSVSLDGGTLFLRRLGR